jgi:hypothetical protein
MPEKMIKKTKQKQNKTKQKKKKTQQKTKKRSGQWMKKNIRVSLFQSLS